MKKGFYIMKKFILLLILQLLFSQEICAYQKFVQSDINSEIEIALALDLLLVHSRFSDCAGKSLLGGASVDVSGLFVPPEFERLRFLSHRNSLSFEEGVEAIMELPHTIPQRQWGVSSDRFVEKWQALYNRVHNRLYIRTQMARLAQDIARLQGRIGGGLYESNEDEMKRILALKQKEFGVYQDIVDITIDRELLRDGHIFDTTAL